MQTQTQMRRPAVLCPMDLMELATALELSLADGNGKPLAGRTLVVNIKEHFEAHLEKKGWS